MLHRLFDAAQSFAADHFAIALTAWLIALLIVCVATGVLITLWATKR